MAAQFEAQETPWIGEWNMNHDGWLGKLMISQETGVRCPFHVDQWCGAIIKYIGQDGKRYNGGVETLRGNHLTFYINFTDRTKFDGYIFSWDKTKMAGTTYWHGRTFGFYAIKVR